MHIYRTYIRLNIHVRMLAHPAALTSYEGSFATVGDLHDVPCYWVRFIPILFKYAIHKEHFSTLVQQAGFESHIKQYVLCLDLTGSSAMFCTHVTFGI